MSAATNLEVLEPRQFNGDFQDDFLSVDQLSLADLQRIYHEADAAEHVLKHLGKIPLLSGHIYDLVFWDSPSTRTKESFKHAITRLDGAYVDFDQSSCSELKGETFEDTIGTLDAYLNPDRDGFIIRNKHVGRVTAAAAIAKSKVINAGDCIGGHPTQGVLDGRTIAKNSPDISEVYIAFHGDNAHARTVNSTAPVLAKLGVKRMAFVAPVEELRAQPAMLEKVKAMGVEVFETDDLREVAPLASFIYGLRTQFEAFGTPEEQKEARARLTGLCAVTPDMVKGSLAKYLHPGPEDSNDLTFAPELRTSHLSLIDEQAGHGQTTRMAELSLMANKPISEKLFEMGELEWDSLPRRGLAVAQ